MVLGAKLLDVALKVSTKFHVTNMLQFVCMFFFGGGGVCFVFFCVFLFCFLLLFFFLFFLLLFIYLFSKVNSARISLMPLLCFNRVFLLYVFHCEVSRPK